MTYDLKNIPVSQTTNTEPVEYEVLFNKIKNELSKFGLTSNQSKVFLFLEKYGPSTATHVSKSLKMPRTETYHLLTNLQNRGIVSASFEHPIKFNASALDKAMETLINTEKERVKSLENKEQDLLALWKSIPSLGIKEEVTDGKFQILQGLNQTTGKINDMVHNAKKSIMMLATEKDFMKFYHAGFLELIKNSKAEVQLISSSSDKTEYIFSGSLSDKVKKMPSKVKEDLCFIITDDEVILFMKKDNETSQNMLAMWTDSYSMTYTLKLLFAYIWSNSKHLKIKKDSRA